MRWVHGLLFDPTGSFVVLVREHGSNPCGCIGVVGPDEDPHAAMVRTARARLGVTVRAWQLLFDTKLSGELAGPTTLFFAAKHREALLARACHPMDEVTLHGVNTLHLLRMEPLMRWAVPFALAPGVHLPLTLEVDASVQR